MRSHRLLGGKVRLLNPGIGVEPADGLFDTEVDWDLRGCYASGMEFTMTAGDDKTTFVGTMPI